MPDNRRASKRFDLPLIAKFRTASGTAGFTLGLSKNLSSQGISLESRDFSFHPNENLDIELKLPQSASSVALSGNVVWRKRTGNISTAGVRFAVKDRSAHDSILKTISTYGNIPLGPFSKSKTARKKKAIPEQHVPASVAVEKGSPPPEQKTGLIKDYIEETSECIVTFTLPKEAAPDAQHVTLAGEFNNWDLSCNVLEKQHNGDFRASLRLPRGHEYRFRYFIDGSRWENDWKADRYIPNEFGSDDSVVVV